MRQLIKKLTAFSLALAMVTPPAMAQYYPPSGGGGGTPGGSSGQIQTNSGGSFGGVTVSGDVSINGSTGASSLTATTNSTLQTLTGLTGSQSGGLFGGTTTYTAGTYNLTSTANSLCSANLSSGTVTIYLPQASTCPGKVMLVWISTQSASYSLSVFPYSGDYVNGAQNRWFQITASDQSPGFGSEPLLFISNGVNGWTGLFNLIGSTSDYGLLYTNSYGRPIYAMPPGVTGAPVLWGAPVSTGNTIESTYTVSASQTLTNTSSHFILASNAITITLTPTINKVWTITNTDSTTKTINVSSGSLYGTSAGSITSQYSSRSYWSDGTNVYCFAANGS